MAAHLDEAGAPVLPRRRPRRVPSRRVRRTVQLVAAGIVLLLAFAAWEGELTEAVGGGAQAVLGWFRNAGPPGAAAALYAEESGIPMPLPGDVFLMYLGRHLPGGAWWLPVWLGLVGVVVLGATNLYWISRRWGRRFALSRIAPAVHLTPERLQRAEDWFTRYGPWALILGRHIPGFRIPITVVAGALEVRYRVFAASVAVSSAVWVAVFLFLGHRYGPQVAIFIASHRRLYLAGAALLAVLVLAYCARILRTAAGGGHPAPGPSSGGGGGEGSSG